jgi:hypothetical protein
MTRRRGAEEKGRRGVSSSALIAGAKVAHPAHIQGASSAHPWRFQRTSKALPARIRVGLGCGSAATMNAGAEVRG